MVDYEQLLSDRVKEVKPSGIRKFFDVVATMPEAISLGVGEPDFETPWQIRRAGIQSLEKGPDLLYLQLGPGRAAPPDRRAHAPQIPAVL